MNNRLSTQQAMRYSRHILLSGFDLEKHEALVNSRGLIVGLGGLGCAASQYLAASGIGSLTLVDDDNVELTNLQRQVLHTEKNIGTLKVESATNTLQQLNSHISIQTYATRLDDDQMAKVVTDQDIVLDCTDNLATRNQLNRICYQLGKPLVSGAAIRMEGQLFNVIPNKSSACYACHSHYFNEQPLSCVESGVMSPLVGIIGSNQALEAIKILTEFGEPFYNQLKLFDAIHNSWQTLNIKPRKECEVCRTIHPADE
jgi:adenylyltransferase/sulfurtransferase